MYETKTKLISPVYFQNVGNKFSDLWVEHRDEHNACNLYMILKIAQQLVTSRELILRDPEKLMEFLLLLGKDPEVQKFNQLHGIIIDIVSYILSQERFSLKINDAIDIIMKVCFNILFCYKNNLSVSNNCLL